MIIIPISKHKPIASPMPAHINKLVVTVYYPTGDIEMATATLNWTPPTTRTDGTTLSPDQILNADIFDTASTTPAIPIGTVVGAANTFTTGILTVGVHNFTVVTNDTLGNSSAASNVASVTVVATLAAPSAVTNLTAVLNTTTAPIVATVTPTAGPVAGGTSVTITGVGFQGASSVMFGTVSATSVVVSADGTSITAVTPASPAGVAAITVVTPNGQSILPNAFTYS